MRIPIRRGRLPTDGGSATRANASWFWSAAEQRYEIEARGHDGDYRLRHADTQAEIRRARFDSGWLSAHFEGEARRVQIACDETCIGVHLDGGVREVFVRGAAFAFESASSAGGDRVLAPMPGRVVHAQGQARRRGEEGPGTAGDGGDEDGTGPAARRAPAPSSR